ncbi:MAG: 4-alpha-glucanotransferase [Legionellales bacterium]|nr:4-alpha-glucanotransferase [Legionellales bacterium]
MIQRSSGLLLHPTSLANQFAIGDLGSCAYEFADFLSQSGQSWWQMLPINPVGRSYSPYQTISTFAGNPLLLSPEKLMEEGFLNKSELICLSSANPKKINFSLAIRQKQFWLKLAFERFQASAFAKMQTDFNDFIEKEASWLIDFSLFMAIWKKERIADWTRWRRDLRLRQPHALALARKNLDDDIRYQQFVQYLFARQWRSLQNYCAQKDIKLIGDVPLFVAHHSSDVWSHPEIFKLNDDGRASVVAGVPPDDFSSTGQCWNMPVYRWDVLEKQGYTWWIQRLRMTLSRFDMVRLDHFIGFVRTYEIPMPALTALNGQYQPGGGINFFSAIREALGVCPFIAEDLGNKTPEVDALREELHIPGLNVMQYAFYEDELPAWYHEKNTVVYTGTHDNDTIMGWFEQLSPEKRNHVKKQLKNIEQPINWELINLAWQSQADITLAPMQDVLGLGSDARMNVPGKKIGNWHWRLSQGELSSTLAEKLLYSTNRSFRDL